MSIDIFFHLAAKKIGVGQNAVRGQILNYFDSLLEGEDIERKQPPHYHDVESHNEWPQNP